MNYFGSYVKISFLIKSVRLWTERKSIRVLGHYLEMTGDSKSFQRTEVTSTIKSPNVQPISFRRLCGKMIDSYQEK